MKTLHATLIAKFFALLESQVGISLDHSKEYLVRTRLTPLAEQLGFSSCEAFLVQLVSTECGPLHRKAFEAIATHETSFFRDAAVFSSLKTTLLPHLIETRQAHKRLDIWCAAASTGQEPYSISMLLNEFDSQLSGWTVRLIATDLSATALNIARAGRYSLAELNRGLSAEHIHRYFFRTPSDEYQILPDIRQRVDFQVLNLLEPWSHLPKFDLILMRNVLIYFGRGHRDKVLEKIRSQLKDEHSYLMLGASESIWSDPAFTVLRTESGSIYQKSQQSRDRV